MAGESAAARARAAEEQARRLREMAEAVERDAAALRKGEEGEALVASILELLQPLGYGHLDDRHLPAQTANLDHVLVGPPGVIVLDAKNWSGNLTLDGSVLRQNGHRRSQAVEKVRSQADAVASLLEQAGFRVPVRPVLCFVGDATLGAPQVVERVHLVHGDQAADLAWSLPPVLDAHAVWQIWNHLDSALPPRLYSPRSPAQPPAEPVVFLTPWRKYGKHRLYVTDELGMEGGYLDLVSGQVVGTSPSAEGILRALLPHYLRDDELGAFDSEERGVVRRFLDSLLGSGEQKPSGPVLVAGYRWRRRGFDRLYVDRLGPGTSKVALGWVDLAVEQVTASHPGLEPQLWYCRQRYLEAQERRGR